MNSSCKTSNETRPGFRRRQLKKDDALRRRIELELSRKRNFGARILRRGKAVPGTVMCLKPSEPIICKPSTSAYEAARLMAARRENCVLVVDNDGHLNGIFTAKDLAFRIVGASLSANVVSIDQIMTPNPVCAHVSSPSSEALNLMVEKGFRHLPVLDDDNKVIAVLDITRAYALQMEKLERLHESSAKLYEALDSVNSEMDLSDQPRQVYEYFNYLKLRMEGSTIESVLDLSTTPVFVNNRTSVYEATLLMKKHKTTAVLICDPKEGVTGIFTSKDVVLRVISAGLDPKNCSLVRVMTLRPDVAQPSTSIQSALRLMYDGHYLNLPIEENGEIVAIVDVLKLTYATLKEVKKIRSGAIESGAHEQQGPVWTAFWSSLDNECSVSGHSGSNPSELIVQSDITPGDSISLVASQISSLHTPLSVCESYFVFKFKSPAVSDRVHRITVKQDTSLSDLRALIDSKLDKQEISMLVGEESPSAYNLSYRDDEGDLVILTSDEDLTDCLFLNRAINVYRAELYLHKPHDNVALISKKPKTQRKFGFKSRDLVVSVHNVMLLTGLIGFATIAAGIIFVKSRN